MNKIVIVFFSANPNDTKKLNLDEEIRSIEEKIQASKYRDRLELISKWASRPDDLLQALNQHRPHIVHFSGHGNSPGEIILVDNEGKSKPVPSQALKDLFTTLKDNIRIVVLNACYSQSQAKAITEVIDCAIGMNTTIDDRAAIIFAASFYRAIGFGRSVQEAFEQGRTALSLEGIPEENTPELLLKQGVDPGKIHLFCEESIYSELVTKPIGDNRKSELIKLSSSKTINWFLKIECDFDSLNSNRSGIEEDLRFLSDDQNLRIKEIDKDDTILHIESSQEGFQRIKQKYDQKLLNKIAEISVKIIYTREQYLKIEQIQQSLLNASKDMLDWPTTLDGQKWLYRKELEQIKSLIQTQGKSFIILLGSPGSGKSALFAKLGNHYKNEGLPVFAIKADMLDKGIKSIDDLGRRLKLTEDPVLCIQLMALNNNVLVIIDQLDALADLVDLHSERLNVLLDFIDKISDIENVYTICSSREFEYRHDKRLNSIQAEKIMLSLPEWEEVSKLLSEKKISTSNFNELFKDFLLIPQHVKIFLEVFHGSGKISTYDSYQSMLETLWGQKVIDRNGLKGRSQLINEIACSMGDEETLWLPAVRFENQMDIVESLVASGILAFSNHQKNVGFQHQTLFDFALARMFAKGDKSLTDFVFERQDALFVRPRLWSSLIYLRGVDKKRYKQEFGNLWYSDTLRLHVRFLLIEFLGHIEDPDDCEIKWFLDYLNKKEFRNKMLSAIPGNKAWYEILLQSHLPLLMELPSNEAWAVKDVLVAAREFARDKNLELIEKHWLPDKTKDGLTWHTMKEMGLWDENTVQIICALIKRSDIQRMYVMFMAEAVSKTAPELAPGIIAAVLKKELDEAINNNPQMTQQPTPEGMGVLERDAWLRSHSPKETFLKILEAGTDWHGLDKIANAAPKAFLNALWPYFVRILEIISDGQHQFLVGYRSCPSQASMLIGDEEIIENTLMSSIEQAIVKFAEDLPGEFIKFLREWESLDILVIQRLLSRGLIKIASTYPEECLNFLINDPGRLILGDYPDEHKDSKALISAVIPYFSKPQILLLEKRALEWTHYREKPEGDSSGIDLERRKWDREHRLSLLKAFPFHSLSLKTQKLVKEEERALPVEKTDHPGVGIIKEIDSPMSGEQMAKAKDEHILKLFNELTDSTGSEYPRYYMKGGSIEASRAFSDFARNHPKRAVSIIKQMSPGCNERPVSYGMQGIAESDYPSEDLFQLILDLDKQGYSSEEFCIFIAWAFEKRVEQVKGLPDAICIMLEDWLSKPWNIADDKKGDTEDEKEHKKDSGNDSERYSSIIWGHGGREVIPQGTYTILRTLTSAYLSKKPIEAKRWLEILKTHLQRRESIEVWRSLLRQLRFLKYCDHTMAIDFLKALFQKYPKVRDCKRGAILVAHGLSWVSADVIKEFLSATRDSGWKDGPQAFGELLMLYYAYFTHEEWSRRELKSFFENKITESANNKKILLGLAFSASRLWNEIKYRDLASEILIKLIPLADKSLSQAIAGIFQWVGPLYPDKNTFNLLESLLLYPDVLKISGRMHIFEKIHDLLPSNPDLVYRICKNLLDILANELVDISSPVPLYASDIINISLRLQRLGDEYRSHGSEIFERLLKMDVYGVRKTLDDLDNRPMGENYFSIQHV